MSDRAGGQRLGLGSDRLRLQLVLDEPAIGAGGVFLERRGAEELDLPHPLQHRLELQRARAAGAAVLGPRPERGLRSRQLDLAGRCSRGSKTDSARPRPPASATIASSRSSRSSGSAGASRSRTSSTKGEREVAPPSSSALRQESQSRCFGAREADREEVAVLDLRLLSLGQGERSAGLVGEQRAAGVAPREVAVLHRADEHVGHAAGAGPVGADHPNPALGRTPPHRHVELGHGRDHVGRGVGEAQLRELDQRSLDLGPRPQLQRPVLLGHGTLAADGRLGDPACLLPGLAQQLGSGLRLAQLPDLPQAIARRSPSWWPGLERLVGRAQPAAQQPALEPVDLRRRGDAGGAQVGEQVRGAASTDRGLEQRDQPRAGGGPGGGQVGLHRDRNAEARQHPAVERTARARVAQDDRDLARWAFRRRGAARPRRPRPRPPRARPRRRAGRRRRRSPLGSPASPKRRSTSNRVTLLREPGLGLQRARSRRPSMSLSWAKRAPSRQGQRLAVLPGQGDRHLGVGGELSHQLQLLDRQVVEAVEEDRAIPRTRASSAARRSPPRPASGRRGGRARPEPADRTRTERRSRPRSGRRPRPRSFKAAGSTRAAWSSETSSSRAAGKPGRREEAARIRSSAREAASRASRSRCVRLIAGPACASVARATRAKSSSKVPTVAPITASPPRVSSSSKRSTSSTVGTTRTGSFAGHCAKSVEHRAGATGVRGADDELQRHSIQHRRGRGARQGVGGPRNGLKSRITRGNPGRLFSAGGDSTLALDHTSRADYGRPHRNDTLLRRPS